MRGDFQVLLVVPLELTAITHLHELLLRPVVLEEGSEGEFGDIEEVAPPALVEEKAEFAVRDPR